MKDATLAELVLLYFTTMLRYTGQIEFDEEGEARVEADELDMLAREVLFKAAEGRTLSADDQKVLGWAKL